MADAPGGAAAKHSTDTVEMIAGQVGYASEYAIHRAFARHGVHPAGRYRRIAKGCLTAQVAGRDSVSTVEPRELPALRSA